MISRKKLKTWQRILDDFVWDYRKPRIAFTTLIRPTQSGGINYPDLQTYYEASLLSSLSKMLDHHDMLDWIHIENSYTSPHSLLETIWSFSPGRPSCYMANPFLLATLATWDAVRNRLVSTVSPLSTYLGQSWFTPALHPSTFSLRRLPGLSRLIDITKQGRLLDKLTLEKQTKQSLPWFQYFQLSH